MTEDTPISNPVTTPPATQQPQQEAVPAPQQQQSQQWQKSEPPHKKPYLLVGLVGLFIILLSVISFLVLQMRNNSQSQELGVYQNTPASPTPFLSPTPSDLSEEEQASDAIDTGDPEADLQSLDKDMQGL